MLPINHSIYYNVSFEGSLTYFKGGKQSQIDFLVTNNHGRRAIKTFTVLKTDWHMSDHLPIIAELLIPRVLASNTLLI